MTPLATELCALFDLPADRVRRLVLTLDADNPVADLTVTLDVIDDYTGTLTDATAIRHYRVVLDGAVA